MNKKILIGSMIAVVILILVSFTGVVGYQSTPSSTIARASPLFTVRSSRAIDEESRDFSCDYVGKGEVTNINIPSRDMKMILLQKYIEKFKDMDETELEENIGKIKNILGSDFKDNIMNRDFQDYFTTPQSDMDGDWTWGSDVWWPGCLIFVVIMNIIGITIMLPFIWIMLVFLWPYPTW